VDGEFYNYLYEKFKIPKICIFHKYENTSYIIKIGQDDSDFDFEIPLLDIKFSQCLIN